jgi:hypothetical protein
VGHHESKKRVEEEASETAMLTTSSVHMTSIEKAMAK